MVQYLLFLECYSQVAGKKYCIISLVVEVITCKSNEIYHSWPPATRDKFHYFYSWLPQPLVILSNTFCQLHGNLPLTMSSHKYQTSHFYQLWNFKIGFQFHILNISKYKDSSAIYLKYDGNIIIQNNIPPTHRALPIIHCNCTYV